MALQADTMVSRNEVLIIDLSEGGSITDPEDSWLENTGKLLHDALATTGLVFFVNHGIAEDKSQEFHRAFDDFRDLPEAVRNKYAYKVGQPGGYSGYFELGTEQIHLKDEPKGHQSELKYCYSVNRLNNKMPTAEIPSFREALLHVVEGFQTLSTAVIKLLAASLELNPALLLASYEDTMQDNNLSTVRVLYYPPVEQEPDMNAVRCGAHIDYFSFTLTMQDSEGGLEIFHNGGWRRVGHVPGGVSFHTAALMDSWTSSLYKAVKHRVVIPEDKSLRCRARRAIVYFVSPVNSTPSGPSFLAYCRTGETVEADECDAFEYVIRSVKSIT